MNFNKKILKSLIRASFGLGMYDMSYRFVNNLKQSYSEEFELFDLEVDTIDDFHWIEETNYSEQMSGTVTTFLNQHIQSGVVERNGIDIYYEYFSEINNLGTIILIHGYNEFNRKYYELVYYFMQLGFDVVTYDSRGHGNSKLYSEEILIDIKNFNDYIHDLDQLLDYLEYQHDLKKPLYLFGHSMGGAVALAMSHDYPTRFNGLILSSPMLMIDTYPFPRSMAHLISQLAIIPSIGKERIPFQTEANRDFKVFQYDRRMSNSKERANYYHEINYATFKAPTQCGTISWLNASIIKLNELAKEDYLKSINLPVLIFKADNDKIVRNDGIYNAANHLPKITLINVDKAGHEIYLERDEILRPYIKAIANFIKQIQ